MFLNEMQKKYPELSGYRDQILRQNEESIFIIQCVIEVIDRNCEQRIQLLEQQNQKISHDVLVNENYKRRKSTTFDSYESVSAFSGFPIGTSTSNETPRRRNGTHQGIEQKNSDRSLDRSSSGGNISETEKEKNKKKEKKSIQGETISVNSFARDSMMSKDSFMGNNINRNGDVSMASLYSESKIFSESSLFDSQFDYDMVEMQKKIVLEMKNTLFLGDTKIDFDFLNDVAPSEMNFPEKKSFSFEDSSGLEKLPVEDLSTTSTVDQMNFLEMTQKLYDLKKENARLTKELNYVLHTGKDTSADLYVKNYYEVLDLLRNKLQENSDLKHMMLKIRLKIEDLENSLQKFVKNEMNTIIREAFVPYRDNLAYFYKKNREIEVENYNLKLLESKYKEMSVKILAIDQYEKKIINLETEIKNFNMKTNLIESLERRIDTKNHDISVLESQNLLFKNENTRLMALVSEKERIISNMVIDEPVKNRILELEQVKKELLREREEKDAKMVKIKENLFVLREFFSAEREKVVEKLLEMWDVLQMYVNGKRNELNNVKLNYEDEKKNILREFDECSAVLNANRDLSLRKDEQIAELFENIKNLKTENAQISNENEMRTQEITDLKENAHTLENRIAEYKKSAVSSDLHHLLELERNEMEKNLKFYKNKCLEFESDKYVDIKQLKDEILALKSQNEELKKSTAEVTELFKQKSANVEDLNSSLADFQVKHSKLCDQLNAVQNEYNSLVKQSQEQKENLQRVDSEKEKHLQEAQDKYNNLLDKFEQFKKENKTNTQENSQETTEKLKEQNKKIENLKSVIIKLKMVNEKLVERAKKQDIAL